MSRFVFRLQRVLDLRKRREDEALARLRDARTALSEAESVCAAVAQRIERRIAGADERMGALDPARLAREAAYLDRLKNELRLAEESRKAAESTVARLQATAIAHARDRRSLEQLRERQARAHAAEIQRAEQKADDEVAQRGRGMGESE